MKIETIDMVAPAPSEPEPAYRTDPGLTRRAVLALVLACVLLVTLRWAVNVTNANARQVSTNLNALRDRIDEPLSTADPSRSAHVHKPRAALAADGPTIEPVDDR